MHSNWLVWISKIAVFRQLLHVTCLTCQPVLTNRVSNPVNPKPIGDHGDCVDPPELHEIDLDYMIGSDY